MRRLRRGSPYILLVVLAIVQGVHLAATIRGVTLLELQERNRQLQSTEQQVTAEWTDEFGIRHTLYTPRRSGEPELAWKARHQEAAAFFSQPQDH